MIEEMLWIFVGLWIGFAYAQYKSKGSIEGI